MVYKLHNPKILGQCRQDSYFNILVPWAICILAHFKNKREWKGNEGEVS
jgi:hypothetical protein